MTKFMHSKKPPLRRFFYMSMKQLLRIMSTYIGGSLL
ncbi:hypothetical protein PAECIP111802_00650 [Paenibacillus allorhizosphaerae]|uniref:Uncharacterized protein n=1 Tax=Paenibacillus allorhizosphaerae TaxID=2849866 RepID=A0ABN7THS0_9BACL|nr:hypothetical protein PAECIP111802_00650 [Paenibacillus allorhizosphaerae]